MTAVDQWELIDGYAAGHNMPDLRTLPLARFCNFIWWIATRNANEAEHAKMKAQLWRPPPPPPGRPAPAIDRRSPWSAESETAGFAALKAGLTGQVALTAATTPEE
jgi:hypothetical protein